jgi:hypothetical protein
MVLRREPLERTTCTQRDRIIPNRQTESRNVDGAWWRHEVVTNIILRMSPVREREGEV